MGTGLARGMQAGCQPPQVYVGTPGCISAGNQEEKALRQVALLQTALEVLALLPHLLAVSQKTAS